MPSDVIFYSIHDQGVHTLASNVCVLIFDEQFPWFIYLVVQEYMERYPYQNVYVYYVDTIQPVE